jgi:hypothetical protein
MPPGLVPSLASPGGVAASLPERLRGFGRLRPAQVGLIGTAIALLLVVLRLLVAADGDIGRFVVAGSTFVDPAAEAGGAGRPHVFPSHGYDGQFFWRLAVDPTEWRLGSHDGVAFDGGYRATRIAYPVLAHLAAGGQAGLVVWSLVGVNLAAVGVVAYAGARIATHGGRDAVWGLVVAAAPGLVMALGRDLAECVTVACVVGGIAALQVNRPLVATGTWTLAVLTREQALLTIGAYAAWRVLTLVRERRAVTAPAAMTGRPVHQTGAAGPAYPAGTGLDGGPAPPSGGFGLHDLPWVAPVIVFGVWQAVLWGDTGRLPIAAAGGTNLVPPFTDLVPGLVGWAEGDLGRIHAVAPLQLAVTVALVVLAGRAARSVPAADRYVVLALGLATLAATCLAAGIWRDPSDLRHLVDVGVLSWVVLLASRRRLPPWAAAATAVAWVATAAARVVAI